MSEMGELFSDYREYKKLLKETYGVTCPQCNVLQPKRIASTLLPGQRCKVDGYRDPRPHLTKEQQSIGGVIVK